MKANESLVNPYEVPDPTNADYENVKNEKNLISSLNGSKLLDTVMLYGSNIDGISNLINLSF